MKKPTVPIAKAYIMREFEKLLDTPKCRTAIRKLVASECVYYRAQMVMEKVLRKTGDQIKADDAWDEYLEMHDPGTWRIWGEVADTLSEGIDGMDVLSLLEEEP